MTTHKAIAAAIVGFLGPILSYLYTWLSGIEPWTWRPFLAFLIGSIITSLAGYGFTWAAPYLPKRVGEHEAAAQHPGGA